MISVREEMAGAIRKYAEPVTAYQVMRHQVQYLVSNLILSMTRLKNKSGH
jgi:chitin synthase